MSLAQSICEVLMAGRPAALVTVVEQSASAPRHVGSAMLVGPEGLIDGTVGGGLLEAKAIEAAKTLCTGTTALFQDVDLSNADAARSDMICGGKMRLFIEPLGRDIFQVQLFQRLAKAYHNGQDMLTLTLASDPSKRIDLKMEEVAEPDPTSFVFQYLQKWVGEAILAYGKGGFSTPVVLTTQAGDVVALPWAGMSKLVLVGGGHVSLATSRIAAYAGFSVTIIDDREEFANKERFPEAARTCVVPEFKNCLAGLGINERSLVAIMTRGHSYDRVALAQALETKAGWVGMIGSRRKTALVFDKLRQEGVSEEALARVIAPIGLSIGAETPEEIAVSIVAQLIAARALMTGNARHLDPALAR